MKHLFISAAIAMLFSGHALAELTDKNMQPNAPATYTVVQGDSLWKISGQYLKHPWLWGELWSANKSEINNPHLIYPGQVLHFDAKTKKLSIMKGKSISGVAKLEPKPYVIENTQTVKAIPWNLLKPFASKSVVIDSKMIESSPRVLAAEDNRSITATGDLVYVKNIPDNKTTKWTILRQGVEIIHPVTKKSIGYEVLPVAQADLERFDSLSVMKITNAVQEVGHGDWLVETPTPKMVNFYPKSAPAGLRSTVVSTLQNGAETAYGQAVLLDIGSQQGVQEGHVFELRQVLKTRIRDDGEFEKNYTLPERKVGLAMVYKVQDNLAFALIMDSTGPTKAGDSAITPGEE